MSHGEAATAFVSPAMSPTGQLLFWLAALAASVVLLAFILLQIRRRMLSDDAGADAPDVLSLEEIRGLKARGEISEREHRALRAAALARMGVDAKKIAAADAEPIDESPSGIPADSDREPGEERTAPPGYDLTGEPLPLPRARAPREGSSGDDSGDDTGGDPGDSSGDGGPLSGTNR